MKSRKNSETDMKLGNQNEIKEIDLKSGNQKEIEENKIKGNQKSV